MSAQKMKLTQLEAFKLQVKSRYSELSTFSSYKLNINCQSKLSSNPLSYYKYVTQQMTGSICTFCLPPIQLTCFYISDAKQKITLSLEHKHKPNSVPGNIFKISFSENFIRNRTTPKFTCEVFEDNMIVSNHISLTLQPHHYDKIMLPMNSPDFSVLGKES